jgi:hypothetical protein
MKLLDKIALNRAMILIGNFILSLIKTLMPHLKKEGDNPIPLTPRPPLWKPRWRKKDDDK